MTDSSSDTPAPNRRGSPIWMMVMASQNMGGKNLEEGSMCSYRRLRHMMMDVHRKSESAALLLRDACSVLRSASSTCSTWFSFTRSCDWEMTPSVMKARHCSGGLCVNVAAEVREIQRASRAVPDALLMGDRQLSTDRRACAMRSTAVGDTFSCCSSLPTRLEKGLAALDVMPNSRRNCSWCSSDRLNLSVCNFSSAVSDEVYSACTMLMMRLCTTARVRLHPVENSIMVMCSSSGRKSCTATRLWNDSMSSRRTCTVMGPQCS
mmetsp:Transcript_6276/g.15909  ORF Transcript_6276/g.15909 Transcript_6276/m.15909 type:complete len:264 (-) Transcript_6276:2126-2917(-)